MSRRLLDGAESIASPERCQIDRRRTCGICSTVARDRRRIATALAGSVPFVGLVAPHALRPLVGGLARRLLPASFLAGAVLVVVADLAARTVSDRLDLPLGSVTAFVGAPYFLFALRTQEGRP